jgi:hypothetical protein
MLMEASFPSQHTHPMLCLACAGLFRSARPSCQSAGINEAPAFLPAPEAPQASSDGSSGTRMQAVPPLGSIKFIVQASARVLAH